MLPQEGGPHTLVECARGVEEHEHEHEEATAESGSGESGAESSPTPGEEKTEASALGGFKLPPAPAFVFNPDLLHTAKALSVALPLSVANTPLQRKRKLTDEWTLSMHWPTGNSWPPAEIEEVFPVGEVVREVCD